MKLLFSAWSLGFSRKIARKTKGRVDFWMIPREHQNSIFIWKMEIPVDKLTSRKQCQSFENYWKSETGFSSRGKITWLMFDQFWKVFERSLTDRSGRKFYEACWGSDGKFVWHRRKCSVFVCFGEYLSRKIKRNLGALKWLICSRNKLFQDENNIDDSSDDLHYTFDPMWCG